MSRQRAECEASMEQNQCIITGLFLCSLTLVCLRWCGSFARAEGVVTGVQLVKQLGADTNTVARVMLQTEAPLPLFS